MYLLVHAILFGLYLSSWAVAARRGEEPPGSLATILAAALLFRVILLPAPPSLSDDIYRYIWEGRLQLEGINPYAMPPSDPRLAPLRDRIWEGINNKDLPAIYPPATEWILAAGAFPGETPTLMKIPFILADMALVVMLVGLLRARGRPGTLVVAYAWSPLAVVEVAGSGHNDPLAVLLLVASVAGLLARRRLLSMGWLGLSALAKLFPLALLPLFGRRVRPWFLAIPVLLVVAGYLPYVPADGSLLTSPRAYAERWRSNESLFAVMEEGIASTGLPSAAKRWADAHGVDSLYAQPHMLARGAAGVVALSVLLFLTAWLSRPGRMLERAIFLFTGTVLLLGPVMHPWYLLWILPWLTLFPSPAWIALSGLIPLSYTGAGWARPVEYGVFFALLAAGLVAGRWRPGRDERVVELDADTRR